MQAISSENRILATCWNLVPPPNDKAKEGPALNESRVLFQGDQVSSVSSWGLSGSGWVELLSLIIDAIAKIKVEQGEKNWLSWRKKNYILGKWCFGFFFSLLVSPIELNVILMMMFYRTGGWSLPRLCICWFGQMALRYWRTFEHKKDYSIQCNWIVTKKICWKLALLYKDKSIWFSC